MGDDADQQRAAGLNAEKFADRDTRLVRAVGRLADDLDRGVRTARRNDRAKLDDRRQTRGVRGFEKLHEVDRSLRRRPATLAVKSLENLTLTDRQPTQID